MSHWLTAVSPFKATCLSTYSHSPLSKSRISRKSSIISQSRTPEILPLHLWYHRKSACWSPLYDNHTTEEHSKSRRLHSVSGFLVSSRNSSRHNHWFCVSGESRKLHSETDWNLSCFNSKATCGAAAGRAQNTICPDMLDWTAAVAQRDYWTLVNKQLTNNGTKLLIKGNWMDHVKQGPGTPRRLWYRLAGRTHQRYTEQPPNLRHTNGDKRYIQRHKPGSEQAR